MLSGTDRPDARLELVRRVVRELGLWSELGRIAITGWTRDGAELAAGMTWARGREEVCLRAEGVVVPAAWSLADTRLHLDLGGEGSLAVTGTAGRLQRRLDWRHQDVELPDRRVDLSIHARPRGKFGRQHRDPVLKAFLVLIDPDIVALARLLSITADTAEALGGDVGDDLLDSANHAARGARVPTETGQFVARSARGGRLGSLGPLARSVDRAPQGIDGPSRAAVRRARTDLIADLASLRDVYPQHGRFAVAGHVHIDHAWLWTADETPLKIESNAAEACHLLDRHPAYHFVQSSAAYHDHLLRHTPDLHARVVAHVRQGRWRPAGGMWLEPDAVLTEGEGLVRQLARGQRWFSDHVGSPCRTAWLPDTFGFPAGLPQLLLAAGIDTFFTTKLRVNDTTTFPRDVFWWEGRDGSTVLAVMSNGPMGYNVTADPAGILDSWQRYEARRRHRTGLLCLGYGGGTAPDEDLLDRVDLLNLMPALPALEYQDVDRYLDEVRREAVELGPAEPTLHGTLYLENHRGTYTAQGRTKSAYRRAVRRLVLLDALAATVTLHGILVQVDTSQRWDAVTRAEFHDVLPGTSITAVHTGTVAELTEVVATAEHDVRALLATCVGPPRPGADSAPVAVFNPSGRARPLRVHSREVLPGGQQVADGWVHSGNGRTLAPLTWTTRWPDGAVNEPARAQGHQLSNGLLTVSVAPDGTLSGIRDEIVGREVLAGPGNRLVVYADQSADWDAWDLGQGEERAGEPLDGPTEVTVVEDGPHRASVRITRTFGAGRIDQELRLWAGSRRLDVATTIDWHDRTWLLRAEFPVAVWTATATVDAAFGLDQHPTRPSDAAGRARFEFPGHRFCDLSEPDYGAALLSDGRHGFSADGNVLGLSLLRSPVYPDPWADEGRSHTTYSLLPHVSALAESDVFAEADDLGDPLVAATGRFRSDVEDAAVQMTGVPLAVSSLARGPGNGTVDLRVFEPVGRSGPLDVAVPDGWTVTSSTDLLGRPVGPPPSRITPFSLHTLRIEDRR